MHRYITIGLVSIFLLSICNVVLLTPNRGDSRVYKGNIYDTFFRDPVEHAVVMFVDGTFFVFCSSCENAIHIDPWMLSAVLEDNDYSLKDALAIIHNHPMGPARFSNNDIQFLRILRRIGFKGKFFLYYQPKKEIIEYIQ